MRTRTDTFITGLIGGFVAFSLMLGIAVILAATLVILR